MTPSFIQYHALTGLTAPSLEYLRDFRRVIDLKEPLVSDPTKAFVRDQVRIAIGNNGHMVIAFRQGIQSSSGGSGVRDGLYYLYSENGGETWSEPRRIPHSSSGSGSLGSGICSLVAATDGFFYVVTEFIDERLEVTAINGQGLASMVYEERVSRYQSMHGTQALAQAGGQTYFFVPAGILGSNFVLYANNGVVTRRNSNYGNLGRSNGRCAVYTVIEPGGFLPYGEIWAIGWSNNVYGAVQVQRTRDGGQTFESLGRASTSYYCYSFGLFVNPDGTRTLIYDDRGTSGRTLAYWNKHDGDGWLFDPMSTSTGVGAPNLLEPPLQGGSGSNGGWNVAVVSDRIALYVRELYIQSTIVDSTVRARFFNDDGTPSGYRDVFSLSRERYAAWVTAVHVRRDGVVTMSVRPNGLIPSEHFYRGNDQGFAPKVPLINGAEPANYDHVIQLAISQNRNHEAVLWRDVPGADYYEYGELWISTEMSA